MPFRFRKSIKIAPGFKLNIGKKGISTTVGKRGASLNIGKRGIKTTIGIPGTGISQTLGTSSSTARPKRRKGGCCGIVATLPLLTMIFVFGLRLLTS